MILHPIIDLLKRIVIALPGYAGGGGELPDGMNHVGSGEVMFASRTLSTVTINHGLSYTPKCVLIWTENAINSPLDIYYSLLTRELLTHAYTTKTERVIADNRSAGLNISAYVSDTADTFITDTYFSVNNGSNYFCAGVTYNWFAFD